MEEKEFVTRARLYRTPQEALKGADDGADYVYAEHSVEAVDARAALKESTQFFDDLVGSERWECTSVNEWSDIYDAEQ